MLFRSDPKAPKRELFWSVNYMVPPTAPIGTIKWNMSVADKDGNTGSYTPIGQEAGLNLLTIAKPAAAKTSSIGAHQL